MTHTKGEWAWQLLGDCYYLIAQHGGREVIIGAIEHPDFKHPVPAMNYKGILREVDNTHPNAKLIAAAPDLLKACQECLKVFDEAGIGADFLTNAIKKATT